MYFKRSQGIDQRDSTTRQKTATAVAAAMRDTAAATTTAATTVLAVLEFITPLSSASVAGWQAGEHMERIESFIGDATGSGLLSDSYASYSSSESLSHGSTSSYNTISSEDAAPEAHTLAHAPWSYLDRPFDPSLPATARRHFEAGEVVPPEASDDESQHEPRQRRVASGQPLAEAAMASERGSTGSQHVVAFHGYRDSLLGEDSSSAGCNEVESFSNTHASSAAVSQGRGGMARSTRMRLLRHILKGPTIKLLCELASMNRVSAPYNASIQQRAAAMLKTWAFQAPDIAAELVSSQYLMCRCRFSPPPPPCLLACYAGV